MLFGSSNAHKSLRKILIEDQKLDGVVSLPSGVFRPYAGVSTAILLFTKTNSGGTDHVWFYDLKADGWSLDDKRTALLAEDKLGPVPTARADRGRAREEQSAGCAGALDASATATNSTRTRTEQSFCVPKADIVAQGYDLSLNRYKEVIHEEVEHKPPLEILADLAELETEIQQGMAELEAMLR